MTSSIPQKRVEEIHKAIQDEVAGEMWYESRQNEEKLQRLLVNLEKRLVRDFTQHHHSLLAEKELEIVRELDNYFAGLILVPDPQATKKNLINIIKEVFKR